MREFKFFQTPFDVAPIEPLNMYCGFDMDVVLMNVIRYQRHHNVEMINNDVPLHAINLPFNDCYFRITTWRTYTNTRPETIEIDYVVFDNAGPIYFTARMVTHEFARQIYLD